MRRCRGGPRAGCHGGLQAVLLVPAARTAALRSPRSRRPARTESGTQLFAGASAVERHRAQGGDCGPGTQVRSGVSPRAFHAVSCPARPDSQIPQARSRAAGVSFNLSTPSLRSRFPRLDLKSVSLVPPFPKLAAAFCPPSSRLQCAS